MYIRNQNEWPPLWWKGWTLSLQALCMTATSHGARSPLGRDGQRPWSWVPLGEERPAAMELSPPWGGTATGHGAGSPWGSSAAWTPQQDDPEFLVLKDCACWRGAVPLRVSGYQLKAQSKTILLFGGKIRRAVRHRTLATGHLLLVLGG